MMDLRRRALLAACCALPACTTTHALRTAPTPGMEVQVEFLEPRNIDVHVGPARDSVPFDGITVVTGRVERTSADTLWLSGITVDSAGKLVHPGPDPRLTVTDVGHSVAVHEVRFSASKSAAAAFGAIVITSAVVLTALLYAVTHDGT